MLVTPVNKKFGRYGLGDKFNLPDKAAKVFVRAGKLRETTHEEELSKRTGLPKRTYLRRDMQAER